MGTKTRVKILAIFLSLFVLAEFASIANAFNIITTADYDEIEDIYDFEEIVTLDPFLSSASIDIKEELSTYAGQIVFFAERLVRSERVTQRMQLANYVPQPSVYQRDVKLWLMNRTLLI